VCGAYSLTAPGAASVLLAVADVLVVKALEKIGHRLVRQQRSRFAVLAGRPMHVAHTLWPTDDDTTTRALKGAWDVVPALLGTGGWSIPAPATDLDAVVGMLDDYVHDLAITGTAHTVPELAYRLRSRLHLPVYGPDHVSGHPNLEAS
jgi:hypothetical protein